MQTQCIKLINRQYCHPEVGSSSDQPGYQLSNCKLKHKITAENIKLQIIEESTS
jgi:hypothetical protein